MNHLGVRQIPRCKSLNKELIFYTGAFSKGIPMGSPVVIFPGRFMALTFNSFNG